MAKLGQLSTAVSCFKLALRLQHRYDEDIGNRADALLGLALTASHSGARIDAPLFCELLTLH
jgi:hypothetical protein